MEDERIVALYFARDEQAIRETDAKYGKLCHRIAYNVLHSDEDAEECVNDTYIGVWNAIPPQRPENLMAFVCKIARNLSLKRLAFVSRQKRSAGVTVSLEELAEILPDGDVASSVSDEAIGRRINVFLHSQRTEVREVFIRKYYFFDSVAEIAQRYGFTESKVKNMLYHTRKRLKDFLIKEGISI